MTPRSVPAPESDSVANEWTTAIARGAIYGFLSRSLLFPTVAVRQSVRSELLPLVESLSPLSARFDGSLTAAIQAHDIGLDELRPAHGRVFTHIENQDCPAHESAYCPGDVFRRADVMADVSAFYRAHGLKVGGIHRERADHITTELEFVSFLARKEAYATEHLGPDQISECRRSQELFLQDHLACWAPGFAGRLRLVSDHPYFDAMGLLLETWISVDSEWLGVQPSSNYNEPQPLPEPDDGQCGTGTQATPVDIGRWGQ